MGIFSNLKPKKLSKEDKEERKWVEKNQLTEEEGEKREKLKGEKMQRDWDKLSEKERAKIVKENEENSNPQPKKRGRPKKVVEEEKPKIKRPSNMEELEKMEKELGTRRNSILNEMFPNNKVWQKEIKVVKKAKPKNIMKGRADLIGNRVEANMNVKKGLKNNEKRALKHAVIEDLDKKIKMSGKGVRRIYLSDSD